LKSDEGRAGLGSKGLVVLTPETLSPIIDQAAIVLLTMSVTVTVEVVEATA